MRILVKNASTVVSDAELDAALPAFQKQVSRDFAPAWDGIAAQLTREGAGDAVIVVCDDADQAGALGYHDLGKYDEPLGKVFAKTTKTYGGRWTVTFSHELLELLADPYINLVAMNDREAALYAYEVCDAVEADGLGYDIDGVRVSDFVLPHWFDEHAEAAAYTSFCRNVQGPFVLAPGGYISRMDLRTGRWKQWRQAALDPWSALALHDAIPRPGSRRERRARGPQSWIRSTL